jgi:TolA-binding protein
VTKIDLCLHRKPPRLSLSARILPAALTLCAFVIGAGRPAYARAGVDGTRVDGPAASDKTSGGDKDAKPGSNAGPAPNSDSAKDAKSPGPDAASAPASTEDQLRQLNEKMKKLEDALELQQQQSNAKVSKLEEIIEQQQKAMQSLQNQVNGGSVTAATTTGGRATALPAPAGPDSASAAVLAPGSDAAAVPTTQPNSAGPSIAPSATAKGASAKAGSQAEEGPLSLKIGSAYITPVGYADFLLYFRSTDVGSGLSTNFGSIPFANTAQGQLSELRTTAQASRLGARIDVMVHDAHVLGYFETDFLGAAPGNAAVTSNSDSQRIRLAFVDVRKGKFEVLGGQSWSLLTPDRNSLSPLPADVYYGHLDPGNQLGLTWKRDPQIRFVYHATDWLALGVSAEQPEQYIGGSGGSGIVTLPSALVTPYSGELDNGNTTQTVPNVAPDFIAKIAFDPKISGRLFHFEIAGLERNFKVYNPLSQKTFTATAGGGSINMYLQVLPHLRILSNNFYSDGGGRYVFGEAPDLVIRGDGSISLVRTYSAMEGFEIPVTNNTTLFGYYGGVYAAKNVVLDPVTHTLVGFGYAGAPTSQNRAIQEPTFGFSQTFWKDPRFGQLQCNLQYSYVTRSPWVAPVKGPTTASTNMLFVDFRYILPGAPPKLPNSY